MKRDIFLGLFLFVGTCVMAQEPSATNEKQLFNDFLRAVYAQWEQDPQSLRYLEKALKQAPDSKYLKRLLVLRALADNKIEVADQYADYINQDENDAEDWNVYGAYLWKKGQISQAEEAYKKAIDCSPEDIQRIYPYLALLSVSSPQKAVDTLEDLAVKYPDMAASLYTEIGNLFLRRKDAQHSLAYYEKALKENPEYVEARLGKAEVYERSSQFFLMLHELEELEKMGFANASTYARMASVYLLGKDFPKAEQYFLKAKAVQNDDVPSCYFLALLSEKKGDFAQAINYLKEAKDYEDDAGKWLQVSFYQQKLNQPQASVATLRQAYQKFPDSVEIAFFYGLALQQTKEWRTAARVFEKLTTSRPDYTDAWFQYAYALEGLKKYKKMETALGHVLTQQPSHAQALNLWAYSLAQRGVRLEEAQGYIARALAVSPNDYTFIDTQAWLYFKQGQLEQAAQLLFAFPAEIVMSIPEIAYHLGAVLAAQGNTQEALSLLEKAREEIPEAEKLYKKLLRSR